MSMRDILSEYVSETSLTVQNVRKLVDDYSLISHYIGEELELNTKYSSPLREGDENPSFSLFYGYDKYKVTTDKLYFKDQIGVAKGDVYDFLKLYLNAKSTQEVLEQINFDLDLGLDGSEEVKNLKPTIIKKIPKLTERPKINTVSIPYTRQFLAYWYNKYGVKTPTLEFYNTRCVSSIHYEYSNCTKIMSPKTLTIGYPIGIYNKIYMPFEDKSNRFKNDYPQSFIEGHIQLDWRRNDFLLISKASKENIFFRNHWNVQSVAGKSETTYINPYFMNIYLNHFKRVMLWLDPDEAGIRAMNIYKSMYPSLEIANFDTSITEKDPTDIFEARGHQFTDEYVKHVLRLTLK